MSAAGEDGSFVRSWPAAAAIGFAGHKSTFRGRWLPQWTTDITAGVHSATADYATRLAISSQMRRDGTSERIGDATRAW